MSIKEYRDTQEKIVKLERLLEIFENIRLLHLAENSDLSDTIPFEDVLKEEGLTMEELDKLANTVVIK